MFMYVVYRAAKLAAEILSANACLYDKVNKLDKAMLQNNYPGSVLIRLQGKIAVYSPFSEPLRRWVSKVMRQHKLNFSNSPLNNSGEVSGFSGELGESLAAV
jgi:hypothetical protein